MNGRGGCPLPPSGNRPPTDGIKPGVAAGEFGVRTRLACPQLAEGTPFCAPKLQRRSIWIVLEASLMQEMSGCLQNHPSDSLEEARMIRNVGCI